MTEPFIAYNSDLTIAFVNRSLASFLNLGEGFYIGKSHWELWPSMKGTIVEEAFVKALKTGEPQSYEYYYPDSHCWFNIRVCPNGGYLHVFFRDISSRVKHGTETALFRTIVDAIPHIAWVLNADGEVVHMNARWQEYAGNNDWSLPAILDAVHTDDIPTVQQYKSARERGESSRFMVRLRRSDGDFRWHRIRTTPLRDDPSRRGWWLGTGTDVHEEVLQRKVLEESEKRLRFALSAAHAGVWEYDPQTQTISWSDECWQLFGEDPSGEPPTFQFWLNRIHADDRDRWAGEVMTAIEDKQGFEIEYRIDHPRTGMRWLISIGSPVDEDPVRLSGITFDITDRKRQNQALQESEEKYRQLAVSVPQLIWSCLADGFCDYLSQQWEEYTGVPVSDHLGYRWLDALHTEDRERALQTWMQAVADGSPYDIEYRLLGRDGQYRWFRVRARSIRDSRGIVIKWFGTCTDVHTEKTKQQALAFLVNLSESTRPLNDPHQIMGTVASLVGAFLSADRCAYAEVEEDEDHFVVAGDYTKGVHSLVGRWRMSEFGEDAHQELLRGKTLIDGDIEAAELSEESRAACRRAGIGAVVCVPLRKDGRFVAAMAVHQQTARNWMPEEIELVEIVTNRCYDAIARARAEGKLRALNDELERRVKERTDDLEGFTYSVSHDLRTPLRAISATSSILLQDFGDLLPTEAKDELRRQAASANKLGQLIDDLLKLSRIGRQEMVRQEINLSEMARDVLGHLVGFPANIIVEDGLRASGDRRLIRLVVENLLSNACKYSPEGGTVRFGRRNGAFYVSDEGIGFDMQYAHKLFMAFERLVREEDFPGTGIGLANVKRIIERHGGEVWAEGQPGVGSTFYFTLG